jgi:hypothetical protein
MPKFDNYCNGNTIYILTFNKVACEAEINSSLLFHKQEESLEITSSL